MHDLEREELLWFQQIWDWNIICVPAKKVLKNVWGLLMNWPFKAKLNLNLAHLKYGIFSILYFPLGPITLILTSTQNLLLCFCPFSSVSSLSFPPPPLFNLALFSFFLPCSTRSSSACVCYLHSSSCCHLPWAAVQTKRKRDQRLALLSKATKIKGWIYKQTFTHT